MTPPRDASRLAICFLAFCRPLYFRQVVNSVSRQSALAGARLYCFLDGCVNERSRVRHASAPRVRECARLFTTAFPDGELHASPANLGIALNYDRAETYLFVQRRYDYVLFLEDDFVLQPHYLQTIRAMICEFGTTARVGAFSAFGDHDATLADQRVHRRRITSMGHAWAVCVPRQRWLAYRRHYLPYLRYIRRFDYTRRPHEDIQHRLYRRWGAKPVASSQDTAKRIAMLKAGQVQISTYANNGYYIGEEGTHFNAALFRRLGYRKRAALLFPQAQKRFTWTDADLDRIEEEQRARLLLP